ncbi:MAG: diaminopimelate epimerase [Mariprofundaceae bacterium]|nr:diaminopimelate epimerase [Mariprofundaceae bacterium]
MHAQGNDFVVLDAIHHTMPPLTQQVIKDLAERRYGIGCDQVLRLCPDANNDARMLIFNTDGSEAINCGNGLRCAADLLMRRMGKDHVSIALEDRDIMATYTEHGVRVCMGSAAVLNACETHMDINIGNAHRVVFQCQGQEAFPRDRNIEIITGHILDHVYIDIIERGVGPTRACGSGACATAIAVWQRDNHARPLTIEMPGGVVFVSRIDDDIYLEGSVTVVFSGNYGTLI